MMVVMMIPHPLPPDPYRGILPAAPPMHSVASVTAGLRDDVGCIWARAAGSLSPFTAIEAESLSSPGPLHCAEPLHQSSLRPQSEGKGQDVEMTPAPTTLNLSVVSEVKSKFCLLNKSRLRRTACLLMLVKSDSDSSSHWDRLHHDVLTLHAIKKNL